MREATIERETGETRIALKLVLDGTGRAAVKSGIGFFDHMLTHIARHGLFDLDIARTATRGRSTTLEDVACAWARRSAALGDLRVSGAGHAVSPWRALPKTIDLAAAVP